MDVHDYQRRAATTAIYSDSTGAAVMNLNAEDAGGLLDLTYCILGLAGEAGELANKFKKVIRDDHGRMSEQFFIDVHSELGDIMWYVAMICTELDFTLNSVMVENIHKLESRKARNMLGGSGDDR